LADPDQLLGVFDGHLDRPSRGVALHHLAGGGLRVGGDQRQVVAAAAVRLAHQHHGDRLRAEHRVPQATDGGGVHGVVGSVAAHRGRGEDGGAGEVGQLRQLLAFLRWPAPPAGACWGRGVEGGVLAQPGGPADLAGQATQLAAGVGGVGDHVDPPAGQRLGDSGDHLPSQPQPGAAHGVLTDQPCQHG